MTSPALAILTYHSLDLSGSVVSLTPRDFAAQMACVNELGFRGITLDEAVSYRELTGRWPERAVVLTFDDGFKNFLDEAMPVLSRHGFTATVFLVSGHVGGRNNWERPPAGLGPRPLLNWQQVSELARCGIEFGAHTRTHPNLRRLPARAAEEEIVASRCEIEERLGKMVLSFAYPYGVTGRAIVERVRREFRAACTTVLRRANDDTLHTLPRVDVYYLRTRHDFVRLLRGQLDRYLSVRRWGRTVSRALPTDFWRSALLRTSGSGKDLCELD